MTNCHWETSQEEDQLRVFPPAALLFLGPQSTLPSSKKVCVASTWGPQFPLVIWEGSLLPLGVKQNLCSFHLKVVLTLYHRESFKVPLPFRSSSILDIPRRSSQNLSTNDLFPHTLICSPTIVKAINGTPWPTLDRISCSMVLCENYLCCKLST